MEWPQNNIVGVKRNLYGRVRQNFNRVTLRAGDRLAIYFNDLKRAVMQMHGVANWRVVDQHNLYALTKFHIQRFSIVILISIDEPLITLHSSTENDGQRAIDLFRGQRRTCESDCKNIRCDDGYNFSHARV